MKKYRIIEINGLFYVQRLSTSIFGREWIFIKNTNEDDMDIKPYVLFKTKDEAESFLFRKASTKRIIHKTYEF